jgi:hypothetical protein
MADTTLALGTNTLDPVMSAIAHPATAPSEPHRAVTELVSDFWSHVSVRFYRFLEKLPEGHEDVDPEVLKRVPVPI